jgi:hypothetical protein
MLNWKILYELNAATFLVDVLVFVKRGEPIQIVPKKLLQQSAIPKVEVGQKKQKKIPLIHRPPPQV